MRGSVALADRPNRLCAMDFVADRLEDGRLFRILTLIDAFTREALCLWAELRMSGEKVARQLDLVGTRRALPEAIRVDNGSEFYSRAMDTWAYRNSVGLDFIRPGKPTENGHIESFNGRLRDECQSTGQVTQSNPPAPVRPVLRVNVKSLGRTREIPSGKALRVE